LTVDPGDLPTGFETAARFAFAAVFGFSMIVNVEWDEPP
jgi:hypothetical protein